jgi:hypothetical protein
MQGTEMTAMSVLQIISFSVRIYVFEYSGCVSKYRGMAVILRLILPYINNFRLVGHDGGILANRVNPWVDELTIDMRYLETNIENKPYVIVIFVHHLGSYNLLVLNEGRIEVGYGVKLTNTKLCCGGR